jgi:peptidoglycan/xylan/chitin deacetylase (PgdA/CDA1 family)
MSPPPVPHQPPDPAALRARRLTAVAALLLGFVLLVAIIASTGGGGSSPKDGGKESAAKHATKRDAGTALPARVPASAPGAHKAPDEAVPILMYHVINKPPAGAPFPDLYVSGPDFAGQMESLRAKGYHGVTLGQVWDAWHAGGVLPSKPVVISFDDGYHGIYVRALPVLRKLRWPGTLNLELRVLDQPEQGGLSRQEVRGLVKAGWEVDSHTVNHPDLTTIGPDELMSELVDSKAQIKSDFGVNARFLCYPAGRYNDAVITAVKAAGYLAATTVDPGLARPSDPYKLPRVRVNGSDGVAGFEQKLAAAESGNPATQSQSDPGA